MSRAGSEYYENADFNDNEDVNNSSKEGTEKNSQQTSGYQIG